MNKPGSRLQATNVRYLSTHLLMICLLFLLNQDITFDLPFLTSLRTFHRNKIKEVLPCALVSFFRVKWVQNRCSCGRDKLLLLTIPLPPPPFSSFFLTFILTPSPHTPSLKVKLSVKKSRLEMCASSQTIHGSYVAVSSLQRV